MNNLGFLLSSALMAASSPAHQDNAVVTSRRDTAAELQISTTSGQCNGEPVSVSVNHSSRQVFVRYGTLERDVSSSISDLIPSRLDRTIDASFIYCSGSGRTLIVIFLVAESNQESNLYWTETGFIYNADKNEVELRNKISLSRLDAAYYFDRREDYSLSSSAAER